MRYQPPSPFYADLKQRVALDFEQRGLPRHGGLPGLAYAVAILCGLAMLHSLILTDSVHGWAFFGVQLGLGVLTYLVAVGIAHDASHGALTGSSRADGAFVRLFDLAAVSSFVWTYDHLRSHHAAVNVLHHDNALETTPLLRFHPSAPHRWWHRHQHVYVWALYACASLNRWFFHDWVRLLRQRSGRTSIGVMPLRERLWFGFGIVSRNALFLVLPALLTQTPLWQIVAGFVAMHLLVSVLLIVAVQLTHQTEGTVFHDVGDADRIDEPWDLAILRTTTDFSPSNLAVALLTGGLNLHTVHHLFAGVHHRHLHRINQILVACARDHGLELAQRRTVWDQITAHHRYLLELGEDPAGVRSPCWRPWNRPQMA